MTSSKTVSFLLLVSMVACTGTVSCRLADSQTRGDKTCSAREAEKGGNEVLTKQEIIAAANRAARRRGYNPAKDYVVYDKGNASWKYFVTRLSPPESESENGPIWSDSAFETNLRSWWPTLDRHDYQAVFYVRHLPKGSRSIVGRTWILVDRNTGEILVIHNEPG